MTSKNQISLRPMFGRVGLAVALFIGFAMIGPDTASGTPQLSPQIFLPGDDIIGPAAGDQHKPEIARGGDQYLAVWVDVRTDHTGILNYGSGPYDGLDTGSMWDIHAVRLDSEGNPIGTTIAVAQQMFNQDHPDVAWNGQNWLVVWQGQAVADAFGNLRTNVYASRVSPTGVVLDDPPIVVDLAPSMDGSLYPMVGSDGTNWFVVWFDVDLNQGIRTLEGMRIAPDGTILDPGGVDVRHAGFNSYPTPWDIEFLGDRYLVVFQEGSTVWGQLMEQDLTPIGVPIRISPSGRSSGAASVATDGTQFFVVFHDYQPGARQVRAARVEPDGSVTTNYLVTASSGFGCYKPMTTFDGTNFIVTYERGLTVPVELRASIVAPTGTPLQTEIPLASGADHSEYSALAGLDNGGAVVVWQDDRNGGYGRRDIMGATMNGAGAVGDLLYLSLGAPRQSQPDAADTETGHTIAFLSDRSTEVRVLVQRVGSDGLAPDAEPVEVVSGGAEITSPAVAWNGSVHLVVWEDADANQVYGRRFAPNLTALDPAPVALLAGNTPDVAASDGTFLVVASEEPFNHIRYPMAVRVDGTTGETIGSALQLGSSYAIIPEVDGFENGGWAVTWERHPTHDNPSRFTHGAVVALDGAFSSFTVSDLSGGLPDVAAATDTALFVFTNGDDIVYKRITSAGTLLDGSDQLLSTASNSQRRPVPAWDGTQFLVEWVDDRNDGEFDQLRGDLYGARVALDGLVLDPDGFAVANDSIPETFAFVSGRDGVSILGGSIYRAEAFSMQRIGYRVSGTVPASAEAEDVTHSQFELRAFPNPSAKWTTIGFRLSRTVRADVAIYDVRGARVRSLHRGSLPAGHVELRWDGHDRDGRAVAPGVYFVRAAVGDGLLTEKILRR